MPDPTNYTRPRNHRFRVRPGRARKIERLLFATAGVFLVFSAVILFRSIATRQNNRKYAEWHQEAQTEATRSTVNDDQTVRPTLARMGLPDGSAITREIKEAQGELLKDAVLSTRYHRTDGEMLPQMCTLRERNTDLCGWLTINGVLDLPVVYRDNRFYMNHDFDGKKNSAGTLFLDETHPVRDTAQHLLIYGHNMRDGTMFGLLTHYQKKEYFQKHPFITLNTLWEEEEYVIFAVLAVSVDTKNDRYFNFFGHPTFSSDQEFEKYVTQMKKLSLYDTFLSVTPEDALLTLCTCVDEDRLLVAARKIRNNENKTVLKSLIR